MRYFDGEKLKGLLKEVLADLGVNEASAGHVAASLVQTSLRGVDSHGINLFPHYCAAVRSGRINRNPEISVAQTAAASVLIDADDSFGHHAGAVAMDTAVGLARSSGIAVAGVRRSTHFGAAAYFALRAAEENFIGFAFTNADALVKAHGARGVFFGTNPICFAAPMAGEEPFCLDMATSLVSWNKIRNYRRMRLSIPEEWAFDENGISVCDANKAVSLSPIGYYKGFGLGMMVDILCALLTASPVSMDLLPMYPSSNGTRRSISHFFMALDIGKFTNVDAFKQNMQSMSDRVRRLAPLGEEQVMVAGDPEKKIFQVRRAGGIPVDEEKYEEFIALSGRFEEVLVN